MLPQLLEAASRGTKRARMVAFRGAFAAIIPAAVDEDGRLLLCHVAQSGLEDDVLLVPNRPRHPLRLGVEELVDRERVVRHRVVVVAADDTRLVDPQLEDPLGHRLLTVDQSEHPERLPV
ncbi:hypothetical protein J0H58_24180 [bacterium]|nr:hypothetical protein [bacterium]